MRLVWIMCLIMAANTAGARSDWQSFAHGWGCALAVDERCPDMWIKTDPVTGNHLGVVDYALAQGQVTKHRDSFAADIPEIGCDVARRVAANHHGVVVSEAWGHRP